MMLEEEIPSFVVKNTYLIHGRGRMFVIDRPIDGEEVRIGRVVLLNGKPHRIKGITHPWRNGEVEILATEEGSNFGRVSVEDIDALNKALEQGAAGEGVGFVVAPVPMLLTCPSCGERHIDEGEWATKVHSTHACQHCGMVWRPALVATVGVLFLPGMKNGS